MHAVRLMLGVMVLLTALYGFQAFLGAETYGNFHEFMFADYVAWWERWNGQLWFWFKEKATNEEFRPYVLIVSAIVGVAILLRIVTISRNICAVIAGVFLFYLGLWFAGGGEQPSTRFTVIGVCALLWMIVSSFIKTEEGGGIGRVFRRIWRRVKS